MIRRSLSVLGRRLIGLTFAVAASAGCSSGPPWFLGSPLDGRPPIPRQSRAMTVARHREVVEQAHAQERVLLELEQLLALEARESLRPAEHNRLVDLLTARTRDWSALHRPIPLAADLRHLMVLAPGRAYGLGPRLRAAEIAAGDAWLAIGENARAEEEYRNAEKRGGETMDIRFRAVWGASVADLDVAALEQALTELPERVLAPFTMQYLDRSLAPKPRLLLRGWTAARVYGPPELLARIEASPASARFRATTGDGGSVVPDTGKVKEAEAAPAGAAPPPWDYLDRGPTLARALIPAAHAFPQILEPSPRSLAWSEHLVAEDPSGPDSLEVAALIDARAGRIGGATRKLKDLVFFSKDRAAGHERAARVWEAAGRTREACAAWSHATRVGAVDDPRWCHLLACVTRDAGAGDPRIVAAHIRQRAPALACAGAAEAPAGEPGDARDEAAPPELPPADADPRDSE